MIKEKILGEVKEGSVVRIANTEFIILSNSRSVICITKNNVGKAKFGKNNKYALESEVDKKCNELFENLMESIGDQLWENDMVELTADNGSEEYGVMYEIKSAPLSLSEYLCFSTILDRNRTDPWWLVTPHGTKKTNNSKTQVCYVDENGMVEYTTCHKELGVRPIVVFSPKIKLNIADIKEPGV